jgi:hypothetical protein
MHPHTIRAFFTPRRVRWLMSALSIVALVAFAIGGATPARALDTSVFELDGNATTDHSGTSTPDDWDRVCHSVLGTDCSTTNNANTTTVEFASQGATTGTTFTGGGSKDPLDISGWAWDQGTGGLPGKDILLNGFAARYSTAPSANCPGSAAQGSCSQIFFGMDRFDNSGDAQNGFWFFQNQITLGANKIGGGQSFNGVHMNGDVLVVSDFSVGGTTSTITVYKWNSTCTGANKPPNMNCADSNLQLLGTSTAANCATALPDAAFCGIVNAANGTTAPWSFTDKSGNTSFAAGEFYEGGIDLSNFGLGNECFASTLAESRSSTSTSAVLKSFVLGQLGSCQSGVETQPQNSSGTDITHASVSIGSGSLQVKDQAAVTVTGISTWTGSVAFFLCGPADLAAQPSCISGGTSIGSVSVSNSSPACPSPPSPPGSVCITSALATITSAATAAGAAPFNYCWRGEFTSTTTGVPPSTDNSTGECFTVTPVTPTLATSATIAGTPSNTTNLPATISDTATLSGTANEPGSPVINPTTAGGPAKGTITFTAFGPNNCTTVAMAATTVNVNGDGTYGPVSFSPSLPGTYTFVASYSGDSPNTNGVPTTACPDTTGTEAVTATDTSSATSAQTWVPNDSATVVSGSGSTSLNGTLKLQLFASSDCTGTAIQTYTAAVSNASTATITSNNTTFVVSGAGSHTVSWLVTFTSSDPNVSSTSHCESTSMTITN